jgi:hypothetical protein
MQGPFPTPPGQFFVNRSGDHVSPGRSSFPATRREGTASRYPIILSGRKVEIAGKATSNAKLKKSDMMNGMTPR